MSKNIQYKNEYKSIYKQRKRVSRKGRLVDFSNLSFSIVDVVKDGNYLAFYEIHVHVF